MNEKPKHMKTCRTATNAGSPFNDKVFVAESELDTVLSTLTPVQRDKISALSLRAKSRLSGPPMKLDIRNDVLHITYAHVNTDAASLVLMAELATCNPAFLSGLTGQVARIGAHGAKIDGVASNFLLSVVRAVDPRDELETMLAVQMGAIHQATMMMARRLNQVETIPQQDAAERALNKLARTYAMQMEALKRYRTCGQQKVTVEHVNVNAGGQAIVGTVHTSSAEGEVQRTRQRNNLNLRRIERKWMLW